MTGPEVLRAAADRVEQSNEMGPIAAITSTSDYSTNDSGEAMLALARHLGLRTDFGTLHHVYVWSKGRERGDIVREMRAAANTAEQAGA